MVDKPVLVSIHNRHRQRNPTNVCSSCCEHMRKPTRDQTLMFLFILWDHQMVRVAVRPVYKHEQEEQEYCILHTCLKHKKGITMHLGKKTLKQIRYHASVGSAVPFSHTASIYVLNALRCYKHSEGVQLICFSPPDHLHVLCLCPSCHPCLSSDGTWIWPGQQHNERTPGS